MRERNQEIFLLRLQGWTLERIGARYGITRQRVWSIIRAAMQTRKSLRALHSRQGKQKPQV